MCVWWLRMKTNPNELSIYKALTLIDHSFEQILQQLERLQKINAFKGRPSVRFVKLAVRETRAWALFEILDVLHQHEEDEWTRSGRARSRLERPEAK
jgi:hypothetical protein